MITIPELLAWLALIAVLVVIFARDHKNFTRKD